MKILLGSASSDKLQIVKDTFSDISDIEVIPCEVSSGITEQPLDLETIKTGAMNRARNA